MEIRTGEADSRCKRNGPSVNVMSTVTVNEIRKTRRTPDPGESHDLLVIDLSFLKHFVERSEDREITASWTPGGVIGSNRFLR